MRTRAEAKAAKAAVTRIAALVGGCVLAALLVRVATTQVRLFQDADQEAFYGFLALARPSTSGPAVAVATTADPVGYALLVAGTLLAGWWAKGLRSALAAGVAILGANLTTQFLKHTLAAPRQLQVDPHSWPSGHMTAAMSVVLAAVLLAPSARRPLIAVVGGVYVVAMGYSLPLLGSHYPSDVLAAVPVAAAWLGLAALALPAADRPWPTRPGRPNLRAAATAAGAIAAIATGAALARPYAALEYAAGHPTFMATAGLIGVAAVAAVTAGAARVRGAP
jgi:membrane-associated phospholipid phosphatase